MHRTVTQTSNVAHGSAMKTYPGYLTPDKPEKYTPLTSTRMKQVRGQQEPVHVSHYSHPTTNSIHSQMGLLTTMQQELIGRGTRVILLGMELEAALQLVIN